jgi:hypothetical protein
MVKLSSGGNFLKGSDVKPGDVIKILDEGAWVENKKYTYPDGNPRWDFICKVQHGTEEKQFRVNATNKKILIAVWGDETSAWVGKTVKLTVETALVAGERRKMILVEPEGSVQNGAIAWDD